MKTTIQKEGNVILVVQKNGKQEDRVVLTKAQIKQALKILNNKMTIKITKIEKQ